MNRHLLIALIAGVVLAQQTGCVPAGPAKPLLLTVFAWVAHPARHPVLAVAARLVGKGGWR